MFGPGQGRNTRSGVFRISVRRGRGAVGVDWIRVWWRGWAHPQKKNQFFVAKIKILMLFAAVF